MPTTRRSAGSARGHTSLTKGQSTLSFHSKVTKNVKNDAKKAVASPPVSKVELPTEESVEEAEVDDVVEPDTKEDSDEEAEVEPEVPEVPEKTESELRAEKVTDAQIDKYWKAIEKKRISPQVHQEGVTTNEKILRYFDVSSHYGPCIGMTRLRRWQRAERLGLNPPIEVLAVLTREDKKPNKNFQIAHMEEIMSPLAVGAVV